MEMPQAWSPRFGGISMTAEKYSEENRKRAIEFIHDARTVLAKLPDGYLKGVRYNSDQSVLAYLESGAGEVEFFKDPLLMSIGALLGAAASDHWYAHEKKWEDHYDYDEENNEEDDQ